MAWGSGTGKGKCSHCKRPLKRGKCKNGSCKLKNKAQDTISDAGSLHDSQGRNRNSIRHRADGSRIFPGDRDW